MANKPILTIDVDDTQFRQFKEMFDHYKSEVGGMPDAWKRANEVLNAGMAAVAEQVHGINHNLRAAITAQHEFAKATSVSASGMKTMAKYAKETYEHIFSMGKFVLRAGAWGGGLLAGATFGLDKLANAALTPSFAARGVNVDPGTYRAFRIDFARLAPAGMLSATWAAKQDPNKYPYVAAALGTSIGAVQHMNTATLAEQMMQAAHRYYQANKNNPNAFMPGTPWMQGFGSVGIDMDRLTLLGNTSMQELKTRTQLTAADAKLLGYTQKTQTAMWEFQRALGLAGAKITTALATDLTPIIKKLGPTFDALGSDVKLLIDDALKPANLKAVQDALGGFTNFLRSGKAKADIEAFVAGVEMLTSAAIGAAKVIDKWLGITPAAAKPKTPGTPSGPFQNFKFNADRHAQMEQVRRGYFGNTFLSDFKSWQTVSDQIGASPVIGNVRSMAESKYGLLPGTLRADASAESRNYLFAVNGNAAGWYQMLPAARKQFRVLNPYDPIASSQGEAAQLASNLATARKLDPLGTMLQHIEMMKAANILGNTGFTKFWREEQAKGRTRLSDWRHDLPADDRADINRFVTALPRSVFGRLLAENRAGQIDMGESRTLNRIARTLDSINKNTARAVRVTGGGGHTPPLSADVASMANAAR